MNYKYFGRAIDISDNKDPIWLNFIVGIENSNVHLLFLAYSAGYSYYKHGFIKYKKYL